MFEISHLEKDLKSEIQVKLALLEQCHLYRTFGRLCADLVGRQRRWHREIAPHGTHCYVCLWWCLPWGSPVHQVPWHKWMGTKAFFYVVLLCTLIEDEWSAVDISPAPLICIFRGMALSDSPFSDRFYMNRKTREPSEMMKVSLLWKLYSHDRIDEERVDPALFEEAYTSEHGTSANQNASCGDLCFKCIILQALKLWSSYIISKMYYI